MSLDEEATSTQPELKDCSSKELYTYLYKERFDNDAKSTTSFLLETIEHVPNIEQVTKELKVPAALTSPTKQHPNNGTAINPIIDTSKLQGLGEIQPLPIAFTKDTTNEATVTVTVPPPPTTYEVSAATPARNKFCLSLHTHGIKLESKKKEMILISPDDVQSVILFPKPEDCGKTAAAVAAAKKKKKKKSVIKIPGDMVLIAFTSKAKIVFKNKVLQSVCFQLPEHEELSSSSSSSEDTGTFEEQWVTLLNKSLSLDGSLVRVYNPNKKEERLEDKFVFCSDVGDSNTSSTSAGMPFVKCYSGYNDGALYPLEEGILFFKPSQFIHRQDLKSIACGRGAGSSRYVDLKVLLDDGENTTCEFTNIEREELKVLNYWIHSVLIKAMQKDADEHGGSESDNSSSKDCKVRLSDVNSSDDGDDEGGAGKGKSKRAESKDAQRVTKVDLNAMGAADDNDDEVDDDDENDMDYAVDENNDDDDSSEYDDDDDLVDEKDIDSDDDNDSDFGAKSSSRGKKRKTSKKSKPRAKKARKALSAKKSKLPSDSEEDEDFSAVSDTYDDESDSE